MFSLLVLIILTVFTLSAIYYILGRSGIFGKVERTVENIKKLLKDEKGTK